MKHEIDLMKIGNIKSKATLKKYPLNKPLMNGNYLFHYLIFTNNLKGLRLYNHPIFRLNTDGFNGLMLAARDKKYKVLNYLLDRYNITPGDLGPLSIEKFNNLSEEELTILKTGNFSLGNCALWS
jgi:hypothetical protein